MKMTGILALFAVSVVSLFVAVVLYLDKTDTTEINEAAKQANERIKECVDNYGKLTAILDRIAGDISQQRKTIPEEIMGRVEAYVDKTNKKIEYIEGKQAALEKKPREPKSTITQVSIVGPVTVKNEEPVKIKAVPKGQGQDALLKRSGVSP